MKIEIRSSRSCCFHAEKLVYSDVGSKAYIAMAEAYIAMAEAYIAMAERIDEVHTCPQCGRKSRAAATL